jgi:hypothetical protein
LYWFRGPLHVAFSTHIHTKPIPFVLPMACLIEFSGGCLLSVLGKTTPPTRNDQADCTQQIAPCLSRAPGCLQLAPSFLLAYSYIYARGPREGYFYGSKRRGMLPKKTEGERRGTIRDYRSTEEAQGQEHHAFRRWEESIKICSQQSIPVPSCLFGRSTMTLLERHPIGMSLSLHPYPILTGSVGGWVPCCKLDLVCAHKQSTASSWFAGSQWPVSKLDLEVFRADISLENHPLPRSIGPDSVRRRHPASTKDIRGSVLCTLVGTSFIRVKG